MLGWIVQKVVFFSLLLLLLLLLCVLISFQSLRFFAFGSFTFLFCHFHVVCSHHNPRYRCRYLFLFFSISLTFSLSFHPSIHFHVFFFIGTVPFFSTDFFFHIHLEFARSAHQLAKRMRIQSCGANITLAIIRKPFLVSSFFPFLFRWYYCCCCFCRLQWCVLCTHSFVFSLLDVSRCGCDLPFTSACITKQLWCRFTECLSFTLWTDMAHADLLDRTFECVLMLEQM